MPPVLLYKHSASCIHLCSWHWCSRCLVCLQREESENHLICLKRKVEFLCCSVQELKNPMTQLAWWILACCVPNSTRVLTSECMPFVESRGMAVSLGITILLKQEISFDKKYKRSLKICIRWRDLEVNTAAFKSWPDGACRHPKYCSLYLRQTRRILNQIPWVSSSNILVKVIAFLLNTEGKKTQQLSRLLIALLYSFPLLNGKIIMSFIVTKHIM